MKLIMKLAILAVLLNVEVLANGQKLEMLRVGAGWIVDSVQGIYADGTTTPKIGGNGGEVEEYSLRDVAKVEVTQRIIRGHIVVGQIVLFYTNGEIVEIGDNLGGVLRGSIHYRAKQRDIMGIFGASVDFWGGVLESFSLDIVNSLNLPDPHINRLVAGSGWIVDSIQGIYVDEATTPKAGGNGGSVQTYSLDDVVQIDVQHRRLNYTRVVGQIVLHYADGTTQTIGDNLGGDLLDTVSHTLEGKVILNMMGIRANLWSGAVETVEFMIADAPLVPTPNLDNAFKIIVEGDSFGFNAYRNQSFTYDYDVDCDSDNVFEAVNQMGEYICEYDTDGSHTISITGDLPHFIINYDSLSKLTLIKQWGNIEWRSFAASFADASSLTTIETTQVPDLSRVSDLSRMFFYATQFNANISNWDVSSIINMHRLFTATKFNGDLATWDVSNVTDMSHMFLESINFNQDISNWNVSNVTNMDSMFFNAINFSNQDLSSWNIDSVTQYTGFSTGWGTGNTEPNWYTEPSPAFKITIQGNKFIFNTNINKSFARNYSVDCEDDGVIEDTNQDGSYTCNYDTNGTHTIAITGEIPHFKPDSDYKTNLLTIKQWGDIPWRSFESSFAGTTNLTTIETADAPDLSRVQDMSYMFWNAGKFNADLSNWNVVYITNMHRMFLGNAVFNGNLSNWDVANVTDMNGMFMGATNFNADLSDWDVNSASIMSHMFSYTDNFNSSLAKWDVRNVIRMDSMFAHATSFNADVSSWNVSNVTDMSSMFYDATSFSNHNLSSWNVERTIDYTDFDRNWGTGNTPPHWQY